MIYEMVLMAIVMVFRPSAADLWLLMILNPLEASRLLMIYSVDPAMTYLGELGHFLVREAGEWFVYPYIAMLPTLRRRRPSRWTLHLQKRRPVDVR